jgi:hypothetical protein
MGDLSGRLDSCTIFTKLDLQKGYFQVPVATADVPKTAVITLSGFSSSYECHSTSKTPE